MSDKSFFLSAEKCLYSNLFFKFSPSNKNCSSGAGASLRSFSFKRKKLRNNSVALIILQMIFPEYNFSFLLGSWCNLFSYSLLDSISKFFGSGTVISFPFGKNRAQKWHYIITYMFLKVPATLQH